MPQKRIAALLLTLLLLSCLIGSAAAQEGGDMQLIDVPINSPVSKQTLHWAYPYSDALFAAPANAYSHTLAQSSLGLAIAAFRQKNEPLQKRDQAVRSYLTDAGFATLKSEEYDVTPSAETIATLIGSKQIGGTTLLAVAVSGGDYEKEWESNFTISVKQYTDGEVFHEGFAKAAASVVARVLLYISENNITGDVKLWLTGYSRAAAVSNLTAYALLEGGVFTEENLYAYTFATPRCMANQDVPTCASIFNIVGSFDAVPTVPFAEWGYDRYGTTLYLPSQELCTDYAERKKPVEPIYQQLTGLPYWNNPQSNWLCGKVMQTLDDMMRNASQYQGTLQTIILDAMNLKGGILGKAIRVYEMIGRNKELTQMLSDVWFSTGDLYSTAAYSLYRQALGMEENQWNHGVSLMAELFHEHCPDVYTAWMFSQSEPDKLFLTNIDYHQLLVSGDVNVAIADEQGIPLQDPVSFALGQSRLYTFPADTERIATLTAQSDTDLNVLTVSRRAQGLNGRLLVWNTAIEPLPMQSGETITLGFPDDITADTEAYASSTDQLTIQADSQSMALQNAFPEMDTALSGDAAHGFLQTLMWSVAVVLGMVILLVVLAVVRCTQHVKRRRRAGTGAGDHRSPLRA